MNTGSNTTVRFERRDDPHRERPEPSVGDTVAGGRYTLLEMIGEGGMGTVFRAEDNTTGRQVALKTLITRYVGRPEREQRLFDEYSYLERIEERAHVVAPIEMGRLAEFEGWPFLVMELVPGRSLFSRFILGRPPSTEETLDIAIQVARAIQAVHRVQVAHRDVTPQNILIHEEDDQLSVNLIDFSHATDTSGPQLVVGDERRLTRVFEVPGTAQYMPPEQADVASGHGKMDIYSFGVVLYEMVTGRNPFAGLTREDYIELQREDSIRVDPIDPRVFPEIPEALIGLIERCTRRRPEGRPDIGQVVRRLMAIQSAVSSPASSASVEVLPGQAEPGHAVASGGVHESFAGAPPRLRVVSREPSPPEDVRGGIGELDASVDEGGSEDPDDVVVKRSQRSGVALVVFLVVVALLLALAWWWGARERVPVPPPSRPKASQGLRAPTPSVDEVEPLRMDAKHPAATQEHQEPSLSEPPAPPSAAASPLSSRDDRESDPPVKRARRPRPRKSDPPALSAQPPSPSPSECRRLILASRAARAQRRWKHVLRSTKDRACWSNATDERLALRVEALMELARWAECAQLGSESPNPRVKRWAAVCLTRANILEDAP